MIKNITRGDYPNIFNDFVECNVFATSYEEHRRGSTFFTRWVINIKEKDFPDLPELWGFWETNLFISDTEYGHDIDDIYKLERVEKIKKMVEVEEWIPV